MTHPKLISSVASRYARSLFELAREQNIADKVRAELGMVQTALSESREFRELTASPVLPAADQLNGITALMSAMKVSDLTANFVKLLTTNRRLSLLSQTITAFEAFADEHAGLISADVTSAEKLSDQQVRALKDALKETTGKDVTLNQRVDQALIGGLVVQLGSRMIDTSLKTKLANMKTALRGQA